jgi:hypothetical protein
MFQEEIVLPSVSSMQYTVIKLAFGSFALYEQDPICRGPLSAMKKRVVEELSLPFAGCVVFFDV